MPRIDLSEDIDGRWIVTLPGLTLFDLTFEAAEAFVHAYRRLKEAILIDQVPGDGQAEASA